MLVNYNLDIVRGSSFAAVLTAKNEDGTAVNLLGFNLRGVIKYKYSDSTYLLSLQPQVVDSANGKINISNKLSNNMNANIRLVNTIMISLNV